MLLKGKSICALAVFMGTVSLLAATADGSRPSVTFTPENIEVVIERKALPVVRFAAQEATNFLSRVFRSPIPVVNAPSVNKSSIILGMNKWSRAAGIDPDSKPIDTFFIKTEPGRVYLAGRDGRYDPIKALTSVSTDGRDKATLFAVYAFLERFAGCRFYFPGELGEIVPSANSITVPNTDISVTPHCLERRIYCPKAAWYDDGPFAKIGRRIDWFRKRLGTTQVPCCHGTSRWKFKERYAKDHPEYFVLLKNGRRYTGDGPGQSAYKEGHLCFSNPGLRQAVFEECIARFARGDRYVDIMPHDANPYCQCDGCQKQYNFSDAGHPASELIWGYTVDIAERLKKAGIKGKVTQMAYFPYRRIPAFDIPDNVEVMVAEPGPFSVTNPKELQREYDEIRVWAKKLGRPVSTWTYPHKWHETMIPGVPDFMPRAIGEYYNGIIDSIFGTFMQSETDRRIFHYLGDYVLSRILWEGAIDVEAVIAEHNRLMFGAAADEMGEFFKILENRWVYGVNGNIEESNVGPRIVPPSEWDLWTKIYSPKTIAVLDELLTKAAAKVQANTIEARRVAFMRAQFFDPLVAQSASWRDLMSKVENDRWVMKSGKSISLRLLEGSKLNRMLAPEDVVNTTVSARRTETALEFLFNCEEPRRKEAVSHGHRKHDDKATWRDSGIEIFLNPSGDRKTVYHFMVNVNKVMCDGVEIRKGGEWSVRFDTSWESGATVDCNRSADGFVLVVSIPRASFGTDVKDRFPAEFCRNRTLKNGKGDAQYVWGQYIRNYKDVGKYGILDISR